MNCAACGHDNPERAKFCLECGAPFAARCASCGVELLPAAKFCLECGTRVGAAPSVPARPAEAPGARTVVSIIFADLVGSTALHERLDAEAVRQFMERYYAAMRAAVEAHGGRVTQVMGDGVKAVFGAPRVAEDDAVRAVRAAVAMQEAFRALADEQRGRVGKTGLRVAVNTGEVVSDGESEIIGDPVNVAARLQEQGKDGDVVIGGATQRIVASLVTLELLGRFALKGRAEQVEAYRVLSLEPPAATKAAFVGRDEELARLAAVYETAARKPAAQLAVLLGSPGLGKSRLIDEFVRRLGEGATVLTAHCDASGGATFAPLAAALREHLGVDDGAKPEALRAALEAVLPGEDAERARIVGGVVALLAGSPASPEETFFVVRRLLAALATAKPVVLVIDDLHWAESLLLDLVEHLVQWGSGVPLFVLVGARPELRELRSSLVVPGGFVADVLTLSGLDAGAAMRLAAGVIGAADLPAALAAKLLATSEGNPLFVGELIKMLVQEGVLHREGERWVASAALADLEMPPTIHALLAARIERLRPEERAVLERAAVVGRHFSRSAVAALLASPGGLDARLEALRRSELIERDTGWYLGEPVLRFHHVLIRDAAYRRVLKGTRAELHARLAAWIETKVGEAAEHDDTIGWHLEQAHQHLAELGPLDSDGVALGERAARRLAAAGRRALARDDLALAANLLGRALACLPPEADERAELALDWCEALLSAGDVAPAATALTELERAGAGSERLRAWHTCFTGQLSTLTSPQGLQATADSASAAAAALAALGDAAGEAKAHFVNAQALARLGKVGACEAALDLALAAARRAGDRRRANAVLAGAPRAALWGPSPVTRASGRCLDVVRVLRITQGAPAVEAVALSCQGVLEALRGRTDAAKRMIASARKLVEELGIAQRLFEADVFAGRVALLEGDASAAEASLRGAYEGLRALGLGIDAAQAAALLARALLAQGRAAEGEALSHESEALAGDDLQAAIAWRGARAEALAQRGEHDEAVRLAQAAVEIAAATDALLDHADARLALATALRSAGRGAEADAEERRARELWETKGATLLAERAAREGARALSAARTPAVATPATRRRRVRPNAASANAARLDAAVAARDGDALLALFADDIHILEHAAGASFDHSGAVASWRGLITAQDPASRHELLATLGESLALLRLRLSASGSRGRSMDVGAYEKDEIHSVETDAQGRRRAGEAWSLNHLGDAVARLYERHAELLPEGQERERGEAVARSISAMASQPDTARRAAVFAPDIEVVDHRTLGTWSARGAESALRHFESIFQVSDAPTLRDHDVLALEPNAVLTLRAHTGVGKESGGAYERRFLNLLVAGADGRLTRIEWFDADREAEALARFDALTAAAAPPGPVPRRVRPNAATALAARFAAAFAERDEAALGALWSDALEVVDHPTGACYGREGHLDSLARLARANTPALHIAPLATLGEDLLLARRSVGASGTLGGRFDVGAWERAEPVLFERDAAGRYARVEIFASERLDDAVVRLYERYAERLPEGPERVRAARAAEAQAALVTGSGDLARLEAAHAPDFEAIDHRRLSLWSGRAASHVEQLRSWQQVAADVRYATREILALAPDALLARVVNTGTDRVGGGDYERPFLSLSVTDEAGRLARLELFEADREADALARFDALLAGAGPPRPTSRRVRENAATRSFASGEAALGARDHEALALLFDASLRVVHHPSGVEYGRREMLGTWRGAMQATRFEFRQEMLASLGDTLALDRHVTTVEGLRDPAMAGFGLSEFHELSLLEVDAEGRWLRSEIFAADRLADGIVRLYERYAELLPEGEERTRAGATARSLAALFGPVDLERWAPALSPSAGIVDHRVLHTWTATNADEYLSQFRHQLALAPDFASRTEDVLALAPRALLVRQLFFGTAPTSGGAFENDCLVVYSFGRDGLLASVDAFEAESEAEAFARFDALSAGSGPAPRGFENAASRADARLMHCFNTRDWPGVLACIAPQLVFDERRRMTRNVAEREVWLEQFRLMFDQPASRFTIRLVATRGERLSLHRHEFEAEVAGGGGPLEMEPHYALHEVDTEGRIVAIVLFDLDDEAAAYTELDARFDTGEGAEHPRAWAWATRFRRAFASRDWDALAALHAPDQQAHNHRLVGWGTLRGPGAWVPTVQRLVDLAPDAQQRVDHLRLGELGLLWRFAWQGTREGGAFEAPMLLVVELDEAGRQRRLDIWDPERLDTAFARFAKIEAPAALPSPFENEASRAWRAVMAAWQRRDAERFRALQPRPLRYRDHRRQFRLDLDREQFLEFTRPLMSMATGASLQLLRTRGERLALLRFTLEAAEDAVGPSAIESLLLVETDERGEIAVYDRYDLDEEEAAWMELDARFDAGEGAAHPRAVALSRVLRRALVTRDWNAFAALMSPDFVQRDHRRLVWASEGRDATGFLAMVRSLTDLAPDTTFHSDHARLCERGGLIQLRQRGSRDGGAFESEIVAVIELDEEGRVSRWDTYDPDPPDAALARFEEIRSQARAAAPFENAATRASARLVALWSARDWEGLARFLPARFRFHDRRRIALLEIDRDAYVESMRTLGELASTHIESELIATRGERLALMRRRIELAGGDVGPSELQNLTVTETNERGEPVALLRFDDDNLDGAFAELDARYAAGEAEAQPLALAWNRAFSGALARRNWDALAATLAPSFVAEDHRLAGWGTLESPARFVDVLRAMVELASDARLRADHQRASGRWLVAHNTWLGTREGGAFEISFTTLLELDSEGRALRLEQYDSLHAPLVLARFAEIAASESEERTAASPFANFATRAVERGAARVAARDWEGFRALLSPGLRYSDRTVIGKLETTRDEWLAAFREQLEMTAGPLVPRVLATRGECLALVRMHWRGAGGDVGDSELDWLLVIEVDERGDHSAVVSFEPSDLAGAYRELDARFADCAIFATVQRWFAAVYRRDREAFLAEFAPSFRVDDRRRLGFGTLLDSADTFFGSQEALQHLAPDFRYRVDHFETRGRAFLTQVAQVGTREGGPFESLFLNTGAVDERGRLIHFELYDVDAIEAARARFDALAAEAPAEPPFANAAYRANQALIRASNARDWASIESLAPSLVLDDRRRIVGVAASVGDNLRFWFQVPGFWVATRLLTTRGERLALHSTTFGGRAPEGGGEVESEAHLDLVELDARGRIVANLLFDIADEATAFAELDARFEAIDRSAGAVWIRAFGSALERRDWDAVAAVYAPDFVGSDHRLVGRGTLRGPVAFLESLRQMFALAPDARMRVDHVRTHERGVITEACWVGTREGGAFESVFVAVIELGPDGRALRADFYDPQHLSRALRRFEEIRTAERRDPPAPFTKPNAASAWLDRFQPAFNARDWDALRARYAPDVSYEDRQRLSLVSGGIDTLWASMRERSEAGARLERFQLLGSAGDRVAIQRLLWAGGEAESRFEMEHIVVQEVDEAGRLVATINFDPGDARAAQREAWARWAALDPFAAPWIALLNEITDAWNAHDAARVRSTFADEFIVDDHRLAGIGRIEGADAYVDTFSALWDLAPDQRIEFGRCCAISPHAVLLVMRRSGTLDGGGAFENEYAWLGVARGGRITRLELFEIEHLDAALARFEVLRPDPLAIPPNAASRAVDAQWAHWQAENWAALDALLQGGTYEDRRTLFELAGGADLHLADLRHLHTTGLAPGRRLLATAGERLALEHMLWSVREEGAASEIELLRVTELGADGRIAAIVIFDPEARAAASDELFERWARQSDCWLPRGTIEFIRAWNRHDRAGLLAALPADYVFQDRRRTGIGRVEGAGPYVDSLIALWKLSPDVRLDFFSIVARDRHGFVGVGRWFGTNAEGGEFEALFLGVAETRGEQQVAVDLFEVEEMDAALARFEQLSAQTAPSSSTRAR